MKIDINTTISFYDPITLDEFNGTIKEYIGEDKSNVVFAVKEANDSILYFLTNREIIQHVFNEPANILYPCIKTGTLRRNNIKENIKLLNLRSLGFHTSLQYCFMNVYEKLPNQQIFVIEDTGLNYPSYVSDDILNQSGNVLGGSHCQGGYEEDKISVLRIPQEIIDSTPPQQGGKKKKNGKKKGKKKTRKGKGKKKTKKGKKKHMTKMKKGKKKTKKRKNK